MCVDGIWFGRYIAKVSKRVIVTVAGSEAGRYLACLGAVPGHRHKLDRFTAETASDEQYVERMLTKKFQVVEPNADGRRC